MCCLLLSLHTGDYWVQEPVPHSTSRQEADSVVSVRWQTTDGILMHFKWAKNITALCLQRVFASAGSDKRAGAPNIKSNWSYNTQTRFILTACRKVIVDDLPYTKKKGGNIILSDLYHHKHQSSRPNKLNRLFRKGNFVERRKLCSDTLW
jgi:hypothetical protein